MSHGRGHLYRALLESTAYGVRHILEVMVEAGGEEPRLVAVGGGTKGGLWTQIMSDVTGRSQTLPRQTIGAAYGDALLAAISVGLADRDADWNPPAEVIRPNPKARDLYDSLYSVYRDLYPATRSHMHTLADIQAGRRP